MLDDVKQLLNVINEMADADKAEIRAQAEKEIVKINEHTEAQIMQFQEEEIAMLEDELRMESESIVGRVELEIRDQIIHTKNETLREVFKRANKQIVKLYETEKYKVIFKNLIQQAFERINCENVRLRISKDDRLLWKSLKGDFDNSFSVVFSDVPKGTVVVETQDGLRSIDNSIRTRLEMAQKTMGRELLEIIFGTET